MENKPSEHFSNRFTVTPTNGPAYVDKETLKQNMLAHEAIFRKQLSEFHRLYKVQKDLMALHFRSEELNGHSQGRSYPSPSGGIRRAQQVGRPVGPDMKKQSENFMKGNNLACNLNGVSLRNSNSGSKKEMLDLQVPADDSDDDVVMMWVEPANSLPRNSGSILGTNVKLNIEGSSRKNNRITGLQPSDVSTVNVLNKEVVGSSSTMKRIDFPSVGASSSQNQCYSSARMNVNLPSLEENLEGKHVGAASGSKFFAANEETKDSNSYSHKKDDRSNSKEWFTPKKNGVDSSTGHYLSSSSIINPQTFAASSSNAAFKSQWQSSSTDHTAWRHYADAEMNFPQNDRLPTFQEYCGLYLSEFPVWGQYQKHSPFYDCPKDANLNNGPRDANTTLGQASVNTPMGILWIRKKLLNMRKEVPMKKSPVPSSCANGHSQIFPGSMAYPEGSTGVFGFTASAATEKDSQRSSTTHMGTDSTPLSKGVANMEIQFQNKKDATNVRNLIDLNVALPFMDDMETGAHQSEGNAVPREPADPFIDLNIALPFMDDMVIDARQSEGDTVPEEPDDLFNEALAITDAKNLMVMHKDEIEAGSPDILRWFADLAISGGNRVVYNSGSSNHDNSEALTLQLFETKDSVYNSALSAQDRQRNEDQLCRSSTFNASYKANSIAATPPEDRYPEGHYIRYPEGS